MASEPHTPHVNLERENAELRRRLDVAEGALIEMREEALARRAEVRVLAESLPVEMSRRAMLRVMVSDARHHPDKAGIAKRIPARAVRAVRKVGRAPRKAVRLVRGRT